jgi:archaellum biogenesis ATPase FlaH
MPFFANEFIFTKTSEDLREKVYAWLSPPDPSSNYNKARELCQERTGTWLLQSKQFADWKADENSFLWLHGIPGCGKTILCSTIVEDVISSCQLNTSGDVYFQSDSVVLHFYFDFNDIDKQSHEKMICSLIMQLSSNNETLPRPLASLYASCLNGQRQPTTETLLETLKEMIQDYSKAFLIIDALDECTKREELLSALSSIAAWKLGMHILVTSRREADIGETITQMGTSGVSIQSTLVNNDIRAYVRERLNSDPKLKRWKKNQSIRDEIETTLIEKAGGM